MNTVPRPGDLLISPANMVDPRFTKTVLLLTHNDDDGSFAFCLNRPSGYSIKDLLSENEDLSDLEINFNFPVYWGGPVNPQTLWLLHDTEWNMPKTIQVNRNWSMTSHVSMFHHIADGDIPKRFRIMFGYSGWGPNQLEAELEGHYPWKKQHSWLIAKNPDPEWLFDRPEDELWSQSIELSASQAVNEWL